MSCTPKVREKCVSDAYFSYKIIGSLTHSFAYRPHNNAMEIILIEQFVFMSEIQVKSGNVNVCRFQTLYKPYYLS